LRRTGNCQCSGEARERVRCWSQTWLQRREFDWLHNLTSWYCQTRLTSVFCYRHLSAWAPTVTKTLGMVTLSCSPLLIVLLLLLDGNVEVNPGPLPYNITTQRLPDTGTPAHADLNADQGPQVAYRTTQSTHHLLVPSPVSICTSSSGCRGIDGKLFGLPQFLQTHNIHVAILTETRRSIGRHKSSQDFQSGGYTFYFSSVTIVLG
jgi:hypothetical protein